MPNAKAYSIEQALALFSINLSTDFDATKKRDLVNDSRKVTEHDIFCAIVGSEQDGRNYIDLAIKNGADLVISQCLKASEHGNVEIINCSAEPSGKGANRKGASRKVNVVQFYQLDFHLFELTKNYYQAPQNHMKMIGITGTNGKTTTSHLIAKLLNVCHQNCAVIGTLGVGKLDNLQPIENTTPGATELHQHLVNFKANNISHVAMEVSSHALVQRRVTAELIDIAVFTNLSRDHLDYHQSMANYAQAKYQLFSQNKSQLAIFNGDDRQAQKWLENWTNEDSFTVYGRSDAIKQSVNFVRATNIVHNSHGVSFNLETHIGNIEIQSALIGDFNIDNLLAAISVLILTGYSLEEISTAVSVTTAISGRMESFSGKGKATTIVDYAHSPDGLSNALAACRQHCTGDLWVVFGCGGDRDKGKRSIMGRIAEQQADHIVLTNDNPRSEMPKNIVNDILTGCNNSEKIIVQLERQQAILSVIEKAKPEDMVLLAGKGDENFIIMGDKKIPYNERKFVQTYYANEAVS